MDAGSFSTLSVQDEENQVQFSLLTSKVANLCLLILEKSPTCWLCCYGMRELGRFSTWNFILMRKKTHHGLLGQRDVEQAHKGALLQSWVFRHLWDRRRHGATLPFSPVSCSNISSCGDNTNNKASYCSQAGWAWARVEAQVDLQELQKYKCVASVKSPFLMCAWVSISLAWVVAERDHFLFMTEHFVP